MRRIRRRAIIVGAVAVFCALAASADVRMLIAKSMEQGVQAAQVFASTEAETREITLSQMEVYALQLGVYDSGERAQSEQQRLTAAGVPCIVWQRDKMRIVCSVSMSREALDLAAAGGNDAYVIKDVLPEVRLRIGAAAGEMDAAAELIVLPDTALSELLAGSSGRALEEIVNDTREKASAALKAHPEHLLYSQLAQSLINWCEIVTAQDGGEQTTKNYALVTMCTICREWRAALLAQET